MSTSNGVQQSLLLISFDPGVDKETIRVGGVAGGRLGIALAIPRVIQRRPPVN
jgi:hypothetical protein